MSKQAIGWGCALVAAIGWWSTNQLTAQESATTAARARVTAQQNTDDAARRINAVLDQPLKTPLRFEGEQLNIVLESIADEYKIPIIFDKAALDELAIDVTSEVSISLQNLSLRSAFDVMLKEPGLEDLCHIIEAEVLLITTAEKANEMLSVQVYRVDDLLAPFSARFNAVDPSVGSKQLVQLLVSNVEHDSWMENGTGEGEIQFFPPGMLVVSQTRRVHDQVELLLHKLRATKQQILSSQSPMASVPKAATQGFVIRANLAEDSDQARMQLAKVVKNSVDWSVAGDQLGDDEAWIEVLPNRVLVRHLPSVLSQVKIVLTDMELLDQAYYSGGGFCGGHQQRPDKAIATDLDE